MNNPLAKQFSIFSLVKFAIPSMVMMLFSSMYIIVDGVFISRVLGTIALSAVNMLYPIISLEMAIGIMIASGGSAIIAKKLGEKKEQEARSDFSFLVLVALVAGIIIALLGVIGMDAVLSMLGVSSLQYEFCHTYGIILFFFAPMFILQTVFQVFFITSGRPTLGLAVTVIAGITNMVLDYLLLVPLHMGIAGTAVATGIGYCIPAITGLVFFSKNRTSHLHFTKPSFSRSVLLKTIGNGSSEMVTNLANAITTFLFNYTFMRYWGENGVASITIVMYFQYVLTAIYFGYANGVAPVISFKYGSGEKDQLHRIIQSSLCFIIICSVASYVLSHMVSGLVISVFANRNSAVYQITYEGIKIYSIGFTLMGINIFISALFTALSDGKTSAIISFTRTFLFLSVMILVLPVIWGQSGVWLAVPVAEALGMCVSIGFFTGMGKKYLGQHRAVNEQHNGQTDG